MNTFFSEELHAATEKECDAPWLGKKHGEYFKCGFCGYKFAKGDLFRVLYSNGTPGAWGNPLVCEKCNDTTENLLARWKAKHDTMNAPEWWWFRRE